MNELIDLSRGDIKNVVRLDFMSTKCQKQLCNDVLYDVKMEVRGLDSPLSNITIDRCRLHQTAWVCQDVESHQL